MIQVLCFGDSNIFGSNPEGVRYPREVRWNGRLQGLLGEEYYVIEEGMGIEKGVFSQFDKTAESKSHSLATLYEKIATNNDCLFLDASKVIVPSKVDGVHMDALSHEKLADAIFQIIKMHL